MSNDTKHLKYTDSAKNRIEEALNDVRNQFELELLARNSVPGDDVVEITGSDVEKVASDMRVTFENGIVALRKINFQQLVVRSYGAIGVLTLAAGIIYPAIKDINLEPVQLALITAGFAMFIASAGMQYYLSFARPTVIETPRKKRRRITSISSNCGMASTDDRL